MPSVNPSILVWARETAGLTQAEAAQKLKLSGTRGSSAIDRLAVLEAGDIEPNRNQLLAMATAYRRPLLTFYMSEPPRAADRGEDFRTLPGERPPGMEAWLDALLRDVRSRQAVVRDVLEEDEDAKHLPFVASMTVNAGVPKVLASIQATLGISLQELRRQPTADKVFAFLRSKVEALGVFVLLVGDLGSHHTAIDTTTFRGFALADPIAPFVVINDKDSRTAWSFTLLHELAHLWIGASGISGGSLSGSPIEQFCNEVATRFLLPDAEVKQFGRDLAATEVDILPMILAFASERKLSPDLVAYRAFRANVFSRQIWEGVSSALAERRETLRAQEAKREKGGGGSFYTTRRHRLGALVAFARRSLDEGSLTPTKAALVLGVKPRMVAEMVAVT